MARCYLIYLSAEGRSHDNEAEGNCPSYEKLGSYLRSNTNIKRTAILTMASISFGGTNSGNQVGINNGTIHMPPGRFTRSWSSQIKSQSHLTISGSERERPETPPAPLSTVPFRRDPDYVARGTLLDQIYEKGTTPSARIALVGLGGVG